MRSNLVDLSVRIRRETDRAWGIASPHVAGELIWIPKSQCEVTDHDIPSGRATLTCESALAEEKEIESLVE